MRISCGTTWAHSLPFRKTAEMVRAAGYGAVDLVAPLPGADALLDAMATCGLTPSSLTIQPVVQDSKNRFTERIKEAADLAHALKLVSLSTVTPARQQLTVAQLASWLERIIVDLGDIALELINRTDSRLEQLEDFRELFVHLPDSRLSVAVDTLEFHRASVDSRGAVDELTGRVTRLVVRDAIGDQQVPLGQGEINILSVLAHADRAGGLVGLSVDPLVSSRRNAVSDLKAERERLVSLLAGT